VIGRHRPASASVFIVRDRFPGGAVGRCARQLVVLQAGQLSTSVFASWSKAPTRRCPRPPPRRSARTQSLSSRLQSPQVRPDTSPYSTSSSCSWSWSMSATAPRASAARSGALSPRSASPVQRHQEPEERAPELNCVMGSNPSGLGLEKFEGNPIGLLCEDARGSTSSGLPFVEISLKFAMLTSLNSPS